jgi:hypothetical protein
MPNILMIFVIFNCILFYIDVDMYVIHEYYKIGFMCWGLKARCDTCQSSINYELKFTLAGSYFINIIASFRK